MSDSTWVLIGILMVALMLSACSARSYSIAVQQGDDNTPHLIIEGDDSVASRLRAVAETHLISGWMQPGEDQQAEATSLWRLSQVRLQWRDEPTRLMATFSQQGPGGIAEREMYLAETLEISAVLVRDDQAAEPHQHRLYRNPLSDARHQPSRWSRGIERVIVYHGDQDQVERAALQVLLDGLRSGVLRQSPTIPLDGRRRDLRAIMQLADTGHHDAALSMLLKRHGQGDEEASLLYNIGAILEAQGKHQQAGQWYARAWSQRPRPLYRERLEQVSQKE